jgi:hypothetical protein
MTEHIGVSGAWKPIVGQWIGVGGAWKSITAKWIGVGGAWKLCYSALTAVASNITKNSSGFATSGTVTSNGDAVSTVTGGSGSYTYSYSLLGTTSGPTATIISGSATNSPVFRAVAVEDGTSSITEWRQTVTDASFGNVTTDDFTVTLTWINDL